jgi:HEAT repeat protein/CheY-like chemotaxis protein
LFVVFEVFSKLVGAEIAVIPVENMLWWTYQQLRVSNPKTRLATVEKLAQSEHSDSVEPLLFALKDGDAAVRSTAARGLGRFQDRRAAGPLKQMLRDPAPLARAAAAEALGQLGDSQAVSWLVHSLRDAEPAVRSRASQSLKQLGWQPDSDTERALQIMATGNLRQAAALGGEAIGPLIELLRNGPPDKQLGAVRALGEMDDRNVIKPLLEALKKNAPAVRIAALEALERFADPSAFDDTTRLLRDRNAGVRSVAVEAAAKCDGNRAVPELIQALKDPSWEVRQAAVRALGTLGDPAAVDELCQALRDKDRDVREGAAMAVGRIGDARGIYFLVLATLDIESTVRNAATNSLQLIDRHWLGTESARQALPEIEMALNHRDYWVRHSATKLLEQINSVVPEAPDTPSPAVSKFTAPPVNAPAKQYQLLFVDDDNDFLAMIRDFFTALGENAWQIHCASSADQALKMLKTRKVDLVVSDVNMPMLDGIQFLHILNRSHPDLKKAIITANATEEKRSACLAEGAELFIEKPRSPEGLRSIFVMLEELITWTPQEGFQGVLRRVGLQDVIQMECLGRTSSILEIHNQQLRGRIYIEEGRIIHAQAGDVAGGNAFYKLLALPSGEFQLQPFEPPPQRTIEGQWEFLLMEAARTRDEMVSQTLT